MLVLAINLKTAGRERAHSFNVDFSSSFVTMMAHGRDRELEELMPKGQARLGV